MPKPIAPLDASEVKKAGSVEAALRIRESAQQRAAAMNAKKLDSAVVRVIGRPPSINVLNGGKLRDRISAKKEYAELCIAGWERSGRPKVVAPYKLAVRMIICGTDFDPSNLYQGAVKVFLDAMQSIGCIEQDNWKAHFGPDKYSWCNATHDLVEFTITSVATKRKF